MTLARLTAKPLSQELVDKLVSHVVSDLSRMSGLRAILLFGSAAGGQMTEASDLDVLLVFETVEQVTEARRTVHGLRKSALWPMDILCLDVASFREKSEIGGVCYTARREGRVLFGEMP